MGLAYAQDPAPGEVGDIQDLSLEALLDPEVNVASKTPLTMRDAPGIITVVRRDEIVRSGARDLMDILRLVPGFSFGVDVEGVVDVGFRGLWGHEGKVLLLLDGQEMNETLYSTMQMGMHVPASHIQRVEIIRGPGSSIYGGYAELAVINVITRDSKNLSGAAADVYYGEMAHDFGRFTASASYGDEVKQVPGLGFTLQTFYGRGNRSDQTYTDYSGNSYPMAGNSAMQSFMLNFGAHFKDLQLRFIYDDYRVNTRDNAGPVEAAAAEQRFESYLVDARYDAHLGKSVVLTPRLSYKRQTPWQVADVSSPLFYNKSADRLTGSLTLSWDIIKQLNLLAGMDAFWDHARLNDTTLVGYQTTFNGNRNVNYGNTAAYLQLIWKNFIANVTVGARYEYHSLFGSSFVPRVGLTKVVGRWNFKVLYSQAFRAPGIENLNINPTLQPERTNIVEAEAGVQLNDHHSITVNGYWIRIDQPIIYDIDPNTGVESYLNATSTGTAGVEAEYRLRYKGGFATLSYSFYSTAGQNQVALYSVPSNPDLMLAFPGHKVALNTGFDLWRDHLTWGFSGVFESARYGYISGDGMGNGVLGAEPNTFLLNTNLAYRDLGYKGLDLMAGVFNLLDTPYRVLQPYNGGHPPLPMGSREVFVRLSYNLGRE
jgi:outer membrane cobalamin receptor